MKLGDYNTDSLRILQYVLMEPGIDCADLAAKTKLSQSTIMRRTKELVEDGLLGQQVVAKHRKSHVIRCLFVFHPNSRLTITSVKTALAMKLIEIRTTKQAQEYCTVLAAIHDANGLYDEMQQLVNGFLTHGKEMLQCYLTLEKHLSEITDMPQDARQCKGLQ